MGAPAPLPASSTRPRSNPRICPPRPTRLPSLPPPARARAEHASTEGRGGGARDGPVFHVRGLCVATIYTTIPAVVRVAAGALGVSSVATALARGGGGGALPPGASQRCQVQSLLVLYGLPRLLCGSIIAHELTHAYVSSCRAVAVARARLLGGGRQRGARPAARPLGAGGASGATSRGPEPRSPPYLPNPTTPHRPPAPARQTPLPGSPQSHHSPLAPGPTPYTHTPQKLQIRMQNVAQLDPQLEEGLCQVGRWGGAGGWAGRPGRGALLLCHPLFHPKHNHHPSPFKTLPPPFSHQPPSPPNPSTRPNPPPQLMAYLWLESQDHAAKRAGPEQERLASYLA